MLESAVEMEKIIGEQLVGKFLILRFGNFYAADSFHTQDLIGKVSKGKMPMFGKGDFYWNFIHINDAADSIVHGLQNFQQLKGRALNVTDFQPLLFSDWMKKLSAITGGKKPFSLPLFLAKIMLGRNIFAFLTNSYRISKDPLLKEWKPKHSDFISALLRLSNEKIVANEK